MLSSADYEVNGNAAESMTEPLRRETILIFRNSKRKETFGIYRIFCGK